MTNFQEECQAYFGTENLYEILGVKKDANESQIRSAYRKKSLKYHPDRVPATHKEHATKAFQILAKVHHVLANEQSRKTYDESGLIILDDHILSSDDSTFEDFQNYWRTIFPKVDVKKLDEFRDKYIGSKEEKEDLKKLYERFSGDLNKIYEYHFYYAEDRVNHFLNEMIESGEIPAYEAFINETEKSKRKRELRIAKEEKLAKKECSKKTDNKESDDLIKAIQLKSEMRQNDLIRKLEEKYGNGSNGKSKNKKRRA